MAATSRFEFATATRIVFGSNTAEKELRSIVDSLGITRPIVVTGTAKRYMGVLKLLPGERKDRSRTRCTNDYLMT